MNLFNKKPKRIFLDYASATPCLNEVKKVMEKFWSLDFYNSSALYKEGLGVKEEIERDRVCLARSLGVQTKGIVFTGSGTESDNLAVLGAFEESRKFFKSPHLIISSVEHPAISKLAEESFHNV